MTDPQDQRAEPAAAGAPAERASRRKPVILAVDDDPQVLAAVSRDLRRAYASRFRIVRAPDGQTALGSL